MHVVAGLFPSYLLLLSLSCSVSFLLLLKLLLVSQGQPCQADRLAHLLVLAFVVQAVVVACFG